MQAKVNQHTWNVFVYKENSCAVSGVHGVSFHLKAEFFNPGPDYLSAGDAPLPTVYASFAVAFGLSLFAWIIVLIRKRPNIHRVHVMMGVLILLKTLSLVFDGSLFACTHTRIHAYTRAKVFRG
jgi:hypothetical protein